MVGKVRLAVLSILLVTVLTSGVDAQNWEDLVEKADMFYEQARYDSAYFYGEKAVATAEQAFSKTDTTVALALARLARIYEQTLKLTEAQICLDRALSIWEEQAEPNYPEISRCHYILGAVFLRSGKYALAEPHFEEALSLREKFYGPDHEEVARSLIGYASLKKRLEDLVSAEEMNRRALRIFRKTLKPDDFEISKPLDNLGDLSLIKGRYDTAATQYRTALDIIRKNYPEDHPLVGRGLGQLAKVYYMQGNYSLSEEYYRKTLAIYTKSYGENSRQVASMRANLGLVYKEQGNFDKSEEYLTTALSIYQLKAEKSYQYLVDCLNHLSDLYLVQYNYDEAEKALMRALDLVQQILGPENPQKAVIMNSLGNVYLQQRHFAKADSVYRESLAILEENFHQDYPPMVKCLKGLGLSSLEQKEYDNALKWLERARTLVEKTFGKGHPEYAKTCQLLSLSLQAKGELEQGYQCARQAVEIRQANLKKGAMVLSEQDALKYSQFLRSSLDNFFVCCLIDDSFLAGKISSISDMVLSTKGQIFDEMFERQRVFSEENNPVVDSLLTVLSLAKYRLSRDYMEGVKSDFDEYQNELDSLAERIDELEKELARASKKYRSRFTGIKVNLDTVRSLLAENSVLLEYVRYNADDIYRDTSFARYAVLVVMPGEAPRFVSLTDEDRIRKLVAGYTEHMYKMAEKETPPSENDLKEYRSIARALYEIILAPVEKYISQKDLIYLAPDGLLNTISFAGLVDEDNDFFIEHHTVHYLLTGRDLLRFNSEKTSGAGLFALGDPDYSSGSNSGQPEIMPRNAAVRSGVEVLKNNELERLPGTRWEIENISKEWKNTTGEDVDIFIGAEASESMFKEKAPGHRVLHLATHGFYIEGYLDEEKGTSAEYENPLMLSGLFLAGANARPVDAGEKIVDDGILTAYEITELDFSGVDLVVLSACETGLGKVYNGEGVYGLRRAFQIAGARTVISSLWPVADAITASFMKNLYKKADENLPEEFRKLCLKNIEDCRKRGQPEHPYLWASFIAIGDWRGIY